MSATRVQTHSRLAAVIEARDPAEADENAALIATHLEAAGELAAAFRWHMRAAEWLRPRDLPAARIEWETARHVADRLPDDHDDVIAMRIAPRTMLMSTAMYVGGDVYTDEHFREFRELAMQTGDLRSLAIAMAGRIWSFTVCEYRVPEAAALAAELEEMVSRIDCDPATRSIILNAVAFGRFANCEFDVALRDIDAILALGHEVPTPEVASAVALRGVIEICLGDNEHGQQFLREGTEQARGLHPVRYASMLHYSGTMAALGMCQVDDLLDDTRDALRRAESFGDIFGIIAAQWAYGTVLLRAENASHDEAIDVLERVGASMQKHKVMAFPLASVRADLAMHAARNGRRDEAIDELRAVLSQQVTSGSQVVVGCPGEALVELLLDRGGIDDFAEAHRIVDQWQAGRPGIPALDLWWLKSRALLAKTEGDSACYAELAEQYLSLCERVDARGRLAEARRMVNGFI